MSFSLSTLICSPVTVFWTLFFCNFSFSIVSGVGRRFVSDDDDDDDDDDDGDEDGDDDGDDDNYDDDEDDKDDDNVDGDEEDDDDDDDDEWLLFCNSSMSLHLANWFNNELIISSLDFNCFRRKFTSSSVWAVNILEQSVAELATFLNESNNLSLNDSTSAKNVFHNLSASSIKSSLKLLKFPCWLEFSISLCFLWERHVLFGIRLHFTEPLLIKESRILSKISLVMFSSIVSFTNLNTSFLRHLLFLAFLCFNRCSNEDFYFFAIDYICISSVMQLIFIWKLLGFLTTTNVIFLLLIR